MFIISDNIRARKFYAREFGIYLGMLQRCHGAAESDNRPSYKYYRHRISVYDDWRKKENDRGFISFLSYIGPRPSKKHSIDRINNNGNYEPGNVRWATYHDQIRNSRHLKMSKSIMGVNYNPIKNLWQARLMVDGYVVLLEHFATEKEAVKARRKAEKKYNVYSPKNSA